MNFQRHVMTRNLPMLAATVLCSTAVALGGDFATSSLKPGTTYVKEGTAGASCGGTPLTQNTNPDMIVAGTVECANAGVTTDNFFARSYAIANATMINCLDFAIEQTVGPAGGTWPVRIRLYSDTNGGAPNTASLVQLGPDVFISIPNATTNTFFTATFPGGVLVPAGTTLVVEEFVACRQTTCITNPPGFPAVGDGGRTYFGSNGLGQSGPTYLKAAACGAADYANLGTLGFPNVHIIQQLGTSAPANPCQSPLPPCNADVAPIGGNGQVNVDDLLAVINTWGANGNPNGPRPQGDTAPLPNGNCLVNVDDLLAVINSWGPCAAPTGACCLPNGTCLGGQTATQCASAGGTYQGNTTTCAGVTCVPVPANDECAGAITVVNGPNNITNVGATTNPTVPGGACAFQGAANFTHDVWYKYTATCTGNLTVDTCGTTGNVTDTVLSLFSGRCTNLTELICDDDSCGDANNLLSSATIPVTTGQVILIRVGSWDGSPTGPMVLTITCVVPNNDFCSDATALTLPATVSGSLATATADTVPDCIGTGETVVGRWYTVTGNGHNFRASTCTGPAEVWDGRINVYCGTNCSTLSCVAGANNNSCNFFQETVDFCTAAGQKYWILVHTPDAQGTGDYTLTVIDLGTTCTTTQLCGPPANDECTGATAITCGGTFTVTADQYALYTANPTDPITSCEIAGGGPFAHDAGWWYKITTGSSQTSLNLTMCATDSTFDTVVGVYSGTCGSLVEVACDDDTCTTPAFGPSKVCATVQPNTQYYIFVNHYSPAQPGDYILTVDCVTACAPPPLCPTCSGTPEGQPCRVNGDMPATDPNGGCNSTPVVFGPAVNVGQTVCGIGSTYQTDVNGNGTIEANEQFRDTDWYLFTPATSGSYTLQACANFPATVGFVTNNTTDVTTCGTLVFVAGAANIPAGTPTNVTSTLTGGTKYVVFMAPSVFTGVPCPTAGTTNYKFTLTSP